MKRLLLSVLLFLGVFGLQSHLYAELKIEIAVEPDIALDNGDFTKFVEKKDNINYCTVEEANRILNGFSRMSTTPNLSLKQRQAYFNKNAINIIFASEIYLSQNPDEEWIKNIIKTLRQHMESPEYKAYIASIRK